jgi:hypothetical protein
MTMVWVWVLVAVFALIWLARSGGRRRTSSISQHDTPLFFPAPPPDAASPLRRYRKADLVEQLRRAQAEVHRQSTTIAALMTEVDRSAAAARQQQMETERLGELVANLQDRVRALQTDPEGDGPGGHDPSFRKLRALIVKELHPDHAPADSIERTIRAEVFKALWPKVEAITGNAV